ncbi:MAG TPA: phosphoribosyltransferase family protein [Candidatus Binatia bacterium]|jgi:predicted phosphoribosyltransferase
MLFKNREHAAHLLAQRLTSYRGKNPLVLAIPRGAVPMAKIIAEALGGELDVVLVHKLGAPGQPELAIGSVDESSEVYLSERLPELGIGTDYIAAEARRQFERLQKRRSMYTLRPAIDPSGRIVIVVDDGIATGATMIAALRSIRTKKPERLIAATAVAPPRTLRRMTAESDEVVCLQRPAEFSAVGEFFKDFSQVTDEEVVEILSRSHLNRTAEG